MIPRQPRSTLFLYTTLFRSKSAARRSVRRRRERRMRNIAAESHNDRGVIVEILQDEVRSSRCERRMKKWAAATAFLLLSSNFELRTSSCLSRLHPIPEGRAD